jgi:trehalose 2-sulfotransferase
MFMISTIAPSQPRRISSARRHAVAAISCARCCGAGQPDDYFWNPTFWYEEWGVADFPSCFRRLLREGTTPNGVFGSKLMWDQLAEVVPQLAALLGLPDADPADVLAATFPNLRYVWLTRHDKVRQGISYYRALETKVWRSTDVPKAPPIEPPFSFEAIQSLVRLSEWEDQAWQDFLPQCGIDPLVVAYEDLARAPEEVARQILRYLGISRSARRTPHAWHHQRQADRLSDAWVERYHALEHHAT